MNKGNLKTWFTGACKQIRCFVKETLPPIAVGFGVGTLIGTVIRAIRADRKTDEIIDWADNEAVPKANEAIERGLDNQERIGNLERQVNTLLEKALDITEGKDAA